MDADVTTRADRVGFSATSAGVPDVSVIVAVYNAMPYLDKCLDSLIGQTIGLDRLEIVAVDDGSTDGGGARLDRLARRHPDSVKVIHQPNSGGPAAPSNRALDVATGRYVFFIGADDYLGPEALARLVRAADELGSDVVAGRMVGVHGRYVPEDIFAESSDDVDLYDSALPFAVSNTKLFRRELLEHHAIRYPEGLPFGSDQPFTVAACVHAKRITVLADYDYYFAIARKTRTNITYSSTHEERLRCTAEIMAHTARLIEPGRHRDAVIVRSFASELWKILQNDFVRLDREIQEMVCAGIASLSEKYYTEGVAARLDVRRRLRLTLAQRGLVDELVSVIETDRAPEDRRLLIEDGRLYAAYDCFRNESLNIPDSVFFITDDLAESIAYQLRVESLAWSGAGRDPSALVITATAASGLIDDAKLTFSAGPVAGTMTTRPGAAHGGGTLVRAEIPIDAVVANSRDVGDRFVVSVRVETAGNSRDMPLLIRARLGKLRALRRRGLRFFHVIPGRNRDGQLKIEILPMPVREIVSKVKSRIVRKLRRAAVKGK